MTDYTPHPLTLPGDDTHTMSGSCACVLREQLDEVIATLDATLDAARELRAGLEGNAESVGQLARAVRPFTRRLLGAAARAQHIAEMADCSADRDLLRSIPERAPSPADDREHDALHDEAMGLFPGWGPEPLPYDLRERIARVRQIRRWAYAHGYDVRDFGNCEYQMRGFALALDMVLGAASARGELQDQRCTWQELIRVLPSVEQHCRLMIAAGDVADEPALGTA